MNPLKFVVPVLAMLFVIAMLIITFTDVWPFMHEVMVQQSWHPVCTGADGKLVFCS